MSYYWGCPGCGTSIRDDPSGVRDHVAECDWVDGAGNALPTRPYEVRLVILVDEAPSAAVAAVAAREDMRDYLRPGRKATLEARPEGDDEAGWEAVETK